MTKNILRFFGFGKKKEPLDDIIKYDWEHYDNGHRHILHNLTEHEINNITIWGSCHPYKKMNNKSRESND